MYEQTLIQSGLESDQAMVYEALLKGGSQKASKIALKTPIKRALTYKILEELIDLGLVIKHEPPKKVATYEPVHPLKLKDLAEKKETKLKTAQLALDGIMGQLSSDFNLISGKPGVQFYEGVDGLKRIYSDMLATGQDILLVRSTYEPVYVNKIIPVIDEFIKKRVRRKINITAITPRDREFPVSQAEIDRKQLLTRIMVDKKLYTAPVEIDLYGTKTALLSFGKELLGVVIDSPQITLGLKQIFQLAKLGAKLSASNADQNFSQVDSR